jgi:hypothetical protein
MAGRVGFATVALALNPARDGPSPLIFAALLVVGAALSFRAFSLKKVFATEGGLVVSNYRRERFVPYDQIAGVRENKLVSGAGRASGSAPPYVNTAWSVGPEPIDGVSTRTRFRSVGVAGMPLSRTRDRS